MSNNLYLSKYLWIFIFIFILKDIWEILPIEKPTHLSFCTPGKNWAISKLYSEVFYFISTLDQRNEPYLIQINILEIKLPCINKWKDSIFHTGVNLLNSQDNQLWKKALKLDVYFLTKICSSVLACVFTQNTHASKHS